MIAGPRNVIVALNVKSQAPRQILRGIYRSLGKFASYGYVPDSENRYWSSLRGEGFAAELAKKGQKASVAPVNGDLSAWVRTLPRPAAVLAAWDVRAAELIACCRRDGIRVPEDVSVLGIANVDSMRNLFRARFGAGIMFYRRKAGKGQ